MKNLTTIKTYLPVFPGFYNTIFEADESNEISDINEIRRAQGWEAITYDQCKFDYEEYNKKVCEEACNYI